jgi:hypothetical protein
VSTKQITAHGAVSAPIRLPIATPPGWSGTAFDGASARPWLRRLTAAEAHEIHAAVSSVGHDDLGRPIVDRTTFVLPTLAEEAAAWRTEVESGRGFIVLRGLPVSQWSVAEAQIAFLGLGSHLGIPQPQNTDGDLVAHVRADRSADDLSARRYETRQDTPFHTDGSDMIALFCLQQGRSGGRSAVVSSVEVVNAIHAARPDLTPLLFEPWPFAMTADASHHFSVPLMASADPFSFFYIRWYIEQSQAVPDAPRLTAEHVELMDLIDAAAENARLDIDFAPGDVQVLSNRRVMHARTTFEDWPEPERRRHLLRLWLQHEMER